MTTSPDVAPGIPGAVACVPQANEIRATLARETALVASAGRQADMQIAVLTGAAMRLGAMAHIPLWQAAAALLEAAQTSGFPGPETMAPPASRMARRMLTRMHGPTTAVFATTNARLFRTSGISSRHGGRNGPRAGCLG